MSMLDKSTEYIGKKVTWDDASEAFPNCYVVFEDYDNKTSAGTLLAVCKNRSELYDFLFSDENKDRLKNINHFYTTESMEINGLWEL